MRFEWDDNKNESNINKHTLDFQRGELLDYAHLGGVGERLRTNAYQASN